MPKKKASKRAVSKSNSNSVGPRKFRGEIPVFADWDEQEKELNNIKFGSDMTVICAPSDAEQLEHELAESNTARNEPAANKSFSGEGFFEIECPSKKRYRVEGRLLACRCRPIPSETNVTTNSSVSKSNTDPDHPFAISITFRTDSSDFKEAKRAFLAWLSKLKPKSLDQLNQEIESLATNSGAWQLHIRQKKDDASAIEPKDREATELKQVFARSGYKGAGADGKVADPKFPVSISLISELLHERIFLKSRGSADVPPEAERLHGAVLLAGRTKSAKSIITRALIHRFISHVATYRFLREQQERRPHLVTCEDPIEAPFYASAGAAGHSLREYVDYTARDRTAKDYEELRKAFADALRQTPACMFIGEVRSKKELTEVIDFAGTGHLVFATLHAGSLNDIFNKVFEAAEVKNSAQRGLVGSRILAAVHLKQLTVTGASSDRVSQIVTPSLWRRTVGSTAALVASGIGSLTPHMNEERHACLGRQHFAKAMIDRNSAIPENMKRPFRMEALNHDLRGE
ncbi:ATPase, T2SS/T4P/T4SS family [Roseimaritima ulvae]|uniref:Twitching mobility protein n=1 Tax=Roseimaritima ulvae TaxID=980254 RepID=A0A5B9QQY8_9BACT|nr:ATPase, T2SS/T4P/T4SS family [Roseimaritima ulvae]QEG41414.1 Twitching mobility protein [Roseimaritima ulvae]